MKFDPASSEDVATLSDGSESFTDRDIPFPWQNSKCNYLSAFCDEPVVDEKFLAKAHEICYSWYLYPPPRDGVTGLPFAIPEQ